MILNMEKKIVFIMTMVWETATDNLSPTLEQSRLLFTMMRSLISGSQSSSMFTGTEQAVLNTGKVTMKKKNIFCT